MRDGHKRKRGNIPLFSTVLGRLRLPSIAFDYKQGRLALCLIWVGIFPLLETNAVNILTNLINTYEHARIRPLPYH